MQPLFSFITLQLLRQDAPLSEVLLQGLMYEEESSREAEQEKKNLISYLLVSSLPLVIYCVLTRGFHAVDFFFVCL